MEVDDKSICEQRDDQQSSLDLFNATYNLPPILVHWKLPAPACTYFRPEHAPNYVLSVQVGIQPSIIIPKIIPE